MACTKKGFATPKLAKRSLRTLQRRTRKTEFDTVRVYHCPACKRWHLGHDW